MFLSVVTAEQSSFGSEGLTYQTNDHVSLGCLVLVPLRKHEVEGIVIAMQQEKPETSFEVKSIIRVISDKPLLPTALLKTFQWLRGYYCCSARQAMQIFLPAPPWHHLNEREPDPVFTLAKSDVTVRGKKQIEIIEFLRTRRTANQDEIIEETGASAATLKALIEKQIVIAEKAERSEGESTTIDPTRIQATRLSDDDSKLVTAIGNERKPVLLVDGRSEEHRNQLFAGLATDCLKNQESALILFPNIHAAIEANRQIEALIGSEYVHVLHSGTGQAGRRELYRQSQTGKPMIVVGTRTALFTPLPSLGLIVLADEHEWTWKSDQTPKYHARLTAEILAKQSGSKLLLTSPTPSLDSLKHALGDDADVRYKLIRIPTHKDAECAIQLIDLGTAQFGKYYPFTQPLVDAVTGRIEKKQASVLFLNRRGTATSLLCLDCRETTLSPTSHLPLRVITRNGKPLLIDEATGERSEVPMECPKCHSPKLRAVGAGTERVEADARILFPNAKIARADADTLDHPKAMEELIERLNAGHIDILLGTQPVLRALRCPRVTLGAILVADVGLSIPDFRAGERIFSTVSSVVRHMHGRENGRAIIQTYRPDAPEIRCAITGNEHEYWDAELKLRKDAGYPPFTQMIELLIRTDRAKALELHKRAKGLAQEMKTSVVFREEQRGGLTTFRITLRGEHPRMLLAALPLRGVSVDIDPVE
ncbi:MAG: primosomal protein N' [Candidatus Peribacteraceae bacterium]|nr:primosomal protein N' [Candidatus Peribacteraceae bacterium]